MGSPSKPVLCGEQRTGGQQWLPVAAIALALAGLYALLAGTTTLWDRDEPRYARTAVEVWEGGNWLVPQINDKPRLRKPPLIYWIMAPLVGLMGPTTLAVRLCSILAMTGTAVLTYLCARRMFTPRVGRWAMAMFGTSGLAIYMGAAAMIDATMILFTTAAIYVFIDAVYRRATWWHWPVMLASFCAITLLKGPLVWPIPLLAMIGAAVLGRSQVRLSRAWWLGTSVCAVTGLLSLLAWAIPANIATGGALYEIGFREHVVKRMTTGMEGHGSSNLLEYVLMLPLYVPLLIGVFFPWTLHLPGAVRSVISRTLGGRRERAILIGATVPWFVMASLAGTKLPHYLLPIFPFLAILTAAGLAARRQDRMIEADRDWLRGGIWFFSPVVVGAIGALLALPWVLDASGLLPVVIVTVVVGGVWAAVAIRLQLRENIRTSTRLLAIGMPVLIVWVVLTVIPTVEDKLKASADLAQAVHQHVQSTDPLYMIDYDEPTMFFYLNRPVGYPVVGLSAAEVADWALGRGAFAAAGGPPDDPHDRREPGGVLIIGRITLDNIEAEHGPLAVRNIWAKPIIDYSKRARQDEILLVTPTAAPAR